MYHLIENQWLRADPFAFPLVNLGNLEIIICDSNSKKKLSIIDYIKQFKVVNIRYYNCTVNHQAYKRNYGLGKSSAEYVIFIDDDCFPGKQFLNNYLKNFKRNRNKQIYWSEQPVIPSYYASLFRSKFPNLRVFGFDLISLTSKLNRIEGKKAHIEFLINNEILIIEDMDLTDLIEAPNFLIVSPLQIKSSDGVPCTIFSF